MAEPIDTDAFRKRHHPVNPVRYDGGADGLVTDGPAVCPRCATQGWPCDASRLADEVDRLRAENAQAWAINRVVKGTNERLADEVDRLRAENAALAAVAEWAQDAPHHDGCVARYNDDPNPQTGHPYRCKCGRDVLDWPIITAILEADRG